MENFESIDEFSRKVLRQETPETEEVTNSDYDSFEEVPLSANQQQDSEELDVEDMESNWVQESISQFQVDPEKLNRPLPEVSTRPPSTEELELEEVALQNEAPEVPTRSTAGSLTGPEIEEYIRQHCQSTIEDIVWKVVPELAKQMIEKEIQKLIREKENFQ